MKEAANEATYLARLSASIGEINQRWMTQPA